MTGLLLTLAGLAAGDGGPTSGAATAPLAVSLSLPWKGSVRFDGSALFDIEVRKGGMLILAEGQPAVLLACAVALDGRGSARVTCEDGVCQGTVRFDGNRHVLSLHGKVAEILAIQVELQQLLKPLRDAPRP